MITEYVTVTSSSPSHWKPRTRDSQFPNYATWTLPLMRCSLETRNFFLKHAIDRYLVLINKKFIDISLFSPIYHIAHCTIANILSHSQKFSLDRSPHIDLGVSYLILPSAVHCFRRLFIILFIGNPLHSFPAKSHALPSS